MRGNKCMSTAIIPKSEMRRNDNIIVGYGEVPATVDEEGIPGWGLPDGQITYSEEDAIAFASKLDRTIRAKLKSISQLTRV